LMKKAKARSPAAPGRQAGVLAAERAMAGAGRLYFASNFSISKLTRYRLLHVSPFFGFHLGSRPNLPSLHWSCLPSVEQEMARSSVHASSSGTMLLRSEE